MLGKLLGAAGLVAGGALAAHVYRMSVAFPNAVRAAGAEMSQGIRDMRRFMDELDQDRDLSPRERERLAQAFIAGRFRSPEPTP